MTNTFGRILLFLSSYFPLGAIFGVLLYSKSPKWAIGIASIAVLGLIGLIAYLRLAQRLSPMQVTVTQIQSRDNEAMSYLATYILPFVAVPFSGLEQGIALAIFFIVVGVLYVNSNLIYINPMLNLAGYHIYEVTLADERVCSLITRTRIRRGASILVIPIGDEMYLEKENKNR